MDKMQRINLHVTADQKTALERLAVQLTRVTKIPHSVPDAARWAIANAPTPQRAIA